MMQLTPTQLKAIQADRTSFLLGPAGSGKTTALHHRLLRLLEGGEPAYTILVLVAEEEDRQRYLDFLHAHNVGPYADLQVATYSSLSREMVRLFWPLVARAAGFDRPYQPPAFLSYDLAQLLMWRIITPLQAGGAFADLRLRPQQIVSQLLDTLNRAALNQLTLEQAMQRQIQTWAGDPEEVRHLREAAHAARLFREHCRRNSLLDLSLTVRVFDTHLVGHPEFYRYFSERFRHLLVDNVEEQTPAGQNFVATLMGAAQTTAIAYDAGGGYKRFLAADPARASQFHDLSEEAFSFEPLSARTTPLVHFSNRVENYLLPAGERRPVEQASEAILSVVRGRYRRDVIQHLVPLLHHLIYTEGLAPHDIVLVAPYLDGPLQYMLAQELQAAEIPFTVLRRRSSPRDEPRIRAWLTWLVLAHPGWTLPPNAYDMAEALTLSINSLDPARAALLVEHLYQEEEGRLAPAGELSEQIRLRVGEEQVQLVERLRLWLAEEGGSHHPPNVFLHKLFNDLLARPPFQPAPDIAGAAVCDWLVRMVGRLQDVGPVLGLDSPEELGRAFLTTINQGLVTANPPTLGDPPDPEGVLIATIHGYLLAGEPARVQVWLDANGTGWWDIPRQPLSNAFVLAQSWPADRLYTMEEDFHMRNQILSRLVRGLAARCQDGLILAASDLDRRGQRQDGPLWRAIQPLLDQAPVFAAVETVA